MSLKWSGGATFDGASGSGAKEPIYYNIVLESESEQPTDEDSESVHSIQGKETDWAKNSSDTTSHSDWSDGIAMAVEYGVASLSEKENPLGDGSLSSDTDDIMCAAGMVVICDDEPSQFADTSGNSDSPLNVDPEVPRADYWTCVQCKNMKNNPLFRYCEKCYEVRKNFFPPRPRGRKRKRRSSNSAKKRRLTTLSDICEENVVLKSGGDTAGPSNIRTDSGLGSSQEFSCRTEPKCVTDSQKVPGVPSSSNSDICMMCLVNPKNGIFVHGKIGHICCCYKCALKVWTGVRRCPCCNCKVNNVLKAIVL
ncbi:E3 ubiquitin-protein ligase Mdm2 isoform X2 [Cryptotermes secundus]|uniref:E3 ubiquitin-protein ligase Mdm2 isoform X2 n=1 Tax=Cryptotermes secundus TaxID=105785 RepID=UPI001454D33E|nr:E3 ubiquitin-protein ligase Mdm2 isoform X2 [Cryptotermes secundus]